MNTDYEKYNSELADLERKKNMMAEWREQAKWDSQRPQERRYNYKEPLKGGPQYMYMAKPTLLGKTDLVRVPNEPYNASQHMQDGIGRDGWDVKGYRRITGDELMSLIDKQQGEHLEQKQRTLDALNPDKPKRGRLRKGDDE